MMGTISNHAPLSKATVLATAFAVASGLGGIVQASNAFEAATVVASPTKSSLAELRQLVVDIQPSASALARALEETYVAVSQGDVDQIDAGDHAEYEAMAQSLRQHEAQIDRIMQRVDPVRDVLMPLRRTLAKARANATIMASLARQHLGEQQSIPGRADPEGMKALANANSEIVFRHSS
ncbi:MAG: hypothetical protein ACQEUG_08735 [Pseudomonadota bacterium]